MIRYTRPYSLIFLHNCEITSGCGRPGYEVRLILRGHLILWVDVLTQGGLILRGELILWVDVLTQGGLILRGELILTVA